MRFIGCVAVVAMIASGCAGVRDDQPDIRSQLRKTVSPQDVANYQHRYDDHLTTCMRAAGFRYAPFHPRSPRERLGLTEQEFTERYGFGISTLIGTLAGVPEADPNVAVRAALHPEAQARYDRAAKDCAAEANRALGPPPNAVLLPNGEDDGYLDVSRKAEADPRVAEAKRAYAACMATNGLTADSGESLQADIHSRAAPFRQGRDRMDPDQVAALEELRRHEIRAAATDKTCGRHLYPVVAQVHAEYHRRYLDGG